MARSSDSGGTLRATLTGLGFVGAATILCGWFYARFGHGGDDGGFILGSSWRIVAGQVPYRDFLYIRPPMSPLLHAVPLALLPGTVVVLFERFLFFTSVATYSWIAAGLLTRLGGVVPRLPLAVGGFVISVLWFPPMPWHTVDGILLAVLGVARLSAGDGTTLRSRGMTALGGFLLVAAALAKQPFALVLPCAVVWVAAERGRRGVVALVTGAAVASGVVLAAAAALGITGAAWSQIVGQTSLTGLVSAGAFTYARGVVHTVVPPLAVWLAARGAAHLVGKRVAWAWFPWLLVSWMFGACFVGIVLADGFQPAAVNFPAALLVVGAVATLDELRRHEAAAPTTALLLAIAWCASISWGWQTPALFATPILFAALEAARRHAGAGPRRLVAAVIVCGIVLQFAGYRRPYADAPRGELVHDLGAALPRLGRIRSNATELARVEEFRRLHVRHGAPSFTVLPGFPLAHFVVGVTPPPGVDWARNPETAGQAAQLARRLEAAGTRAFVERDARICRDGPACSALTAHVVDVWSIVERGRYFDVYAPPPAGRGAGGAGDL